MYIDDDVSEMTKSELEDHIRQLQDAIDEAYAELDTRGITQWEDFRAKVTTSIHAIRDLSAIGSDGLSPSVAWENACDEILRILPQPKK